MSVSVTKGIWFFRLQIEVPYNGRLPDLAIQLCAKEVFYETNLDGSVNYDKMVAETPEVVILTLPNPIEMEGKYSGISEAMRLIQSAAITEGILLMQARSQSATIDPTAADSPDIPPLESGV